MLPTAATPSVDYRFSERVPRPRHSNRRNGPTKRKRFNVMVKNLFGFFQKKIIQRTNVPTLLLLLRILQSDFYNIFSNQLSTTTVVIFL